jgi:hypothetical protein
MMPAIERYIAIPVSVDLGFTSVNSIVLGMTISNVPLYCRHYLLYTSLSDDKGLVWMCLSRSSAGFTGNNITFRRLNLEPGCV